MGERDLVHHLVKEAADRQIPSTAVADTELAGLRSVEAAARALLDDVDTAIADGVSTELKEALRTALGSLREGG